MYIFKDAITFLQRKKKTLHKGFTKQGGENLYAY